MKTLQYCQDLKFIWVKQEHTQGLVFMQDNKLTAVIFHPLPSENRSVCDYLMENLSFKFSV